MDTSEERIEKTRKRAEGKICRWREDGTYDSKPLDPNYFTFYYRKMSEVRIDCDICGKKDIIKLNISKHKKTLGCRKCLKEILP